jgi:CheY-like chemotaxis protein
VANNGLEAIAALEREPFDIVLMDVQMPEMGGFEATIAIRQREERTGARVRIVAMTAHVMTGDRERCFAAGMDGYLSKPIEPGLLFAAVEQDASETVPRTQPRATAPVDCVALLARLGGDAELFADVSRLFLEYCPAGVAAIKAALDGHDAGALRSSAHAFRGAASNLSADALCDAAQTLERLGEETRLEAAEAAWRRLSLEADAVMEALRNFDRVHQRV